MAGNITEKPLTVNVNFGKLFLTPPLPVRRTMGREPSQGRYHLRSTWLSPGERVSGRVT